MSLPEDWPLLTDSERKARLRAAFMDMKDIRNRCSSATPQDIAKVAAVVYQYQYFTNQKLRVSACQIPAITSKVAILLHGWGLVSSPIPGLIKE